MDAAAVGASFNLQEFLDARKVTMEIVETMAKRCEPGISEDEAQAMMKALFLERGIAKTWHPTKIRFGSNTTKSFREPSEPNTRLQKEDIYYFDIGPVWHGHEGDYGRTYTVGKNSAYAEICEASEKVFFETAEKWKKERLTGLALYAYAARISEKLGYNLDPRMDGHRVGDFPHALHWKKDLGEFEGTPAPNLWILEILLQDSSGKFGAFFEDLLMEE